MVTREPKGRIVGNVQGNNETTIIQFAFWLLTIVTFLLFIRTINLPSLSTVMGVSLFMGRASAIGSAYLCIIAIALMARAPVLELTLGRDRIANWHKTIGHLTFQLMTYHLFFTTLGYAMRERVPIIEEFVPLILDDRYNLWAFVSFILFTIAVVTSVHAAKKRLRYETWFYIHAYTYLAIALYIPHQFLNGTSFIGNRPMQLFWGAMYSVMLFMVFMRFARPIWNLLRYQIRVTRIVREADNAITITMRGIHLNKLHTKAGQFFYWRFLQKGFWWESHPYSISSDSTSSELRITVKALGDSSSSLTKLKRGTRVIAEGPFGIMHTGTGNQKQKLLIAGGVGAAPMRSIFESERRNGHYPVMIYRARNVGELLFKDEFDKLLRTGRGHIEYMLGRTNDYPNKTPLSPTAIRNLVPDVLRRDVFLCGPPAFISAVYKSLLQLGCPPESIHREDFES